MAISDTVDSTLPQAPVRAGADVYLIGLGHGGTHWIAATFYLLLPAIQASFGLSYAEAGGLVAVFHIASAAANLGSGVVVDITGRRVAYQVISLLIGSAALLGFMVDGGFAWLAAMVALIGASNNLWHPAAISFLSQRYPRTRGYVLSIHTLGASAGDAIAPMVIGVLLTALTWQQVTLAGALPPVLCALVLAVVLWPQDIQVAGPGRGGSTPGDWARGFAALMRNRAVMSLALMSGVRAMAQSGLLVFLPLYLANVLQTSPWVMGLTMTAMQVGGLIASPIFGHYSDRAGRRPVVMAGLGVTTVMILVLTVVGGGILFVAGVSVLGFALFAVRPVIQSWMMDLTPAEQGGTATSVLFGSQAILSALSPLLGGWVADQWGVMAVFYLLAFWMLLANVLTWFLPNQEPAARST